MNKQKRIRTLTWKYFFQQKIKEINGNIEMVMGLSLAVSLLAVGIGMGLQEEGYNILGSIIGALGCSILIFWLLLGIIILFKNFFKWIISNWKEAKRRAIKDIQNGCE